MLQPKAHRVSCDLRVILSVILTNTAFTQLKEHCPLTRSCQSCRPTTQAKHKDTHMTTRVTGTDPLSPTLSLTFSCYASQILHDVAMSHCITGCY